VEKILVARRVATKLFSTEKAVDAALVEATEFVTEMLRAKADINLATTSSDPAIAKVIAAISALSEARTAMADAHGELNDLKLRLGIRTKMDTEDKVEPTTGSASLREVA
jgi:hypothetical protein